MVPLGQVGAAEAGRLLASQFGVKEAATRDVDGSTLAALDDDALLALGLSVKAVERVRSWASEGIPEEVLGRRLKVKPTAVAPAWFSASRNRLAHPSDPTPRVERRRSLDEFLARGFGLRRKEGSTGSLDTARSSRLEARLDLELQRYATSLPDGVVSIEARRPHDWIAHLRRGDHKATAKIEIPPNYPFQGPEVHLDGYTVQFVMGQQYHDARSSTLQAMWTPAQSIADALRIAVDAVRRASLEDRNHRLRCAPAPTETTDRR